MPLYGPFISYAIANERKPGVFFYFFHFLNQIGVVVVPNIIRNARKRLGAFFPISFVEKITIDFFCFKIYVKRGVNEDIMKTRFQCNGSKGVIPVWVVYLMDQYAEYSFQMNHPYKMELRNV